MNFSKTIRIALLAAGFCVAVQPAARTAFAETADWTGYGVLKGGKGYAPSPMGEVHYRDLGPHDQSTPLLLLHMTPFSMIQFSEVQPELAAMGVRSIAVDTPGYGMSDPPPQRNPSVPELADNLIAVLDHLHIQKVIVAGHHSGSAIAAAFAVQHPDRVAGIILHGVPIFNDAEIAQHLDHPPPDRTPKPDGSHLTRFFRPIPEGQPGHSAFWLYAETWYTLSFFNQGPDIGHSAVYRYDMLSDLKAIHVPGMILSDTIDPLYPVDQRAIKIRPDFAYREFSDEDALTILPKSWAKIAADFRARIIN